MTQPPAPITAEKWFCINCGREMRYNPVAKKWFCDNCPSSSIESLKCLQRRGER